MIKFMSIMNPKITGPAVAVLPTTNTDISKFYGPGRKAIQFWERETGVKIVIGGPEYPRQEPREIGFLGHQGIVEQAQKGIEEFLQVSNEGVFFSRAAFANYMKDGTSPQKKKTPAARFRGCKYVSFVSDPESISGKSPTWW